jgi:branched-chain amino acid transport system ATP-binding protein
VSLLVVQDLCKTFGAVVAARDVDFTVSRGELVALIGPNGAGKSTVFNMIGGQLKPDRGAVTLDDEDVTRLTPREKFRRGVGRTFQVAQTFLSMSVAENVQMALISLHRETRALWSKAAHRYRDEAMGLLEQVGMADFADRPCSTLAYGDVKRLELAIALASRPKLLLMDEPTAGMAPRVLFTEHDMDVVFGHAGRVLVLMRGEIIAAGTPDEVRANPRVRQAYLGDTHALEPAR